LTFEHNKIIMFNYFKNLKYLKINEKEKNKNCLNFNAEIFGYLKLNNLLCAIKTFIEILKQEFF
jgi:hypothetical protein